MTNESTPANNPAAVNPTPDPDADPKSDDMRNADTANGENPDADVDDSSPDTRHAETSISHPTGERQARENAEHDPPA